MLDRAHWDHLILGPAGYVMLRIWHTWDGIAHVATHTWHSELEGGAACARIGSKQVGEHAVGVGAHRATNASAATAHQSHELGFLIGLFFLSTFTTFY